MRTAPYSSVGVGGGGQVQQQHVNTETEEITEVVNIQKHERRQSAKGAQGPSGGREKSVAKQTSKEGAKSKKSGEGTKSQGEGTRSARDESVEPRVPEPEEEEAIGSDVHVMRRRRERYLKETR